MSSQTKTNPTRIQEKSRPMGGKMQQQPFAPTEESDAPVLPPRSPLKEDSRWLTPGDQGAEEINLTASSGTTSTGGEGEQQQVHPCTSPTPEPNQEIEENPWATPTERFPQEEPRARVHQPAIYHGLAPSHDSGEQKNSKNEKEKPEQDAAGLPTKEKEKGRKPDLIPTTRPREDLSRLARGEKSDDPRYKRLPQGASDERHKRQQGGLQTGSGDDGTENPYSELSFDLPSPEPAGHQEDINEQKSPGRETATSSTLQGDHREAEPISISSGSLHPENEVIQIIPQGQASLSNPPLMEAAMRNPDSQHQQQRPLEAQWEPPQPPMLSFPGTTVGPYPQTRFLRELIGRISEPLRSTIIHSPHMSAIPLEWYDVTTMPIYGPRSRHTADQMRVADPNLLATFVRADLNAILQDPSVRLNEVRSFARNKYNITTEDVASITRFTTLARLMATVEEILRNHPHGIMINAAGECSPTRILHVYSHIAPLRGSPVRPRTDWVLAAAKALDARLQARRYTDGGERTRVTPSMISEATNAGDGNEQNAEVGIPTCEPEDYEQEDEVNDFLEDDEEL